MPKLLSEIQSKLQGLEFDDKTLEFNAVLCNFYRDGKDSVSWHSDDEASLHHTKSNIGSVSFGDTRKFVIRHLETRVKVEFELAHGDIFIMGGKFQRFWEHQVPKTSKKVGPRLNLTYRYVD